MAFTEQEITQWLAELDTVITSGTLGERELNEMELQRIQSLRRLVELKINPYPAEKFEVTNYAIPTKENYCLPLCKLLNLRVCVPHTFNPNDQCKQLLTIDKLLGYLNNTY